MTYSLDIELNDIIDETIESVMDEVEEAVHCIRKRTQDRGMHREEVDSDDLLPEHQCIGIVWDVSHVKDQRPDLNDEQAWEALQATEYDRLMHWCEGFGRGRMQPRPGGHRTERHRGIRAMRAERLSEVAGGFTGQQRTCPEFGEAALPVL